MNQVCKAIKYFLNVHEKIVIENRWRHMKIMSQNFFSASSSNPTLWNHRRGHSQEIQESRWRQLRFQLGALGTIVHWNDNPQLYGENAESPEEQDWISNRHCPLDQWGVEWFKEMGEGNLPDHPIAVIFTAFLWSVYYCPPFAEMELKLRVVTQPLWNLTPWLSGPPCLHTSRESLSSLPLTWYLEVCQVALERAAQQVRRCWIALHWADRLCVSQSVLSPQHPAPAWHRRGPL